MPQNGCSAGTARAYADFCRLQPPPCRSLKRVPESPRCGKYRRGERETDVLRACRAADDEQRAALPARPRSARRRAAERALRAAAADDHAEAGCAAARDPHGLRAESGTRQSRKPSGCTAPRSTSRPPGRSGAVRRARSAGRRADRRAPCARSARTPPRERAGRRCAARAARGRRDRHRRATPPSVSRRRTNPGRPCSSCWTSHQAPYSCRSPVLQNGCLRARASERHPVDLAIDVRGGHVALHPHRRRLGQPLGETPAALAELDRVEQLVRDASRAAASTPVVVSGATSAAARSRCRRRCS